jgi:beta-galactosidase
MNPPARKFRGSTVLAAAWLVLAALSSGHLLADAPAGRERLLMDFNWRFALGNANDEKKDFGFGTFWGWLAKQNNQKGAVGRDFDDSSWRVVNLPHDWGFELPFDRKATATWGYRPLGRDYPATSIGWYRKTFAVPASDKGRRFNIEFEGVMHDCIVFCNGIFVGTHFSGYTSFGFDITDLINYGGKNVITVRVDAQENEGWWYQGAGIYRHVWLTKSAPVHVPQWGTQVISEVAGDHATVTAHTLVANDSDDPADVVVNSLIIGDDGQTVASGSTPAEHIAPWKSAEVVPAMQVENPKLWSTDAPYLYRLVTVLTVDGREVDRYETPFGIRTVQFDPDRGFLLNGKVLKICGFADHEQRGEVGPAVPDALWDWSIKELKKTGCNAIRMAHNPAPPAYLDACDRLGMMVLDEQRLFSSSQEGLDQLQSMVRRDRNHPSIILWSAGNEEFTLQSSDTGEAIARTLQRNFHELDPTREVTFAASNGGVFSGINKVIDVRGINYLILFDKNLGLPLDKIAPRDPTPEEYHKHHPAQPIIATEETDMPDEGQPASYVNQGREIHWKFIAEHPWLSGAFIWTGCNYYAEDKWPHIAAPFSAMDLCGFPNPGYWFFRQAWTGQAPPPKPPPAGPAAAIQFQPDRLIIRADGEDLSVVNVAIVDAKGQLVPTAGNRLTFSISGPGKILALGNGNRDCHELAVGNRHSASEGHAQVLVQASRQPGTILLGATAKGCSPGNVRIVTEACAPRPYAP